MKYHYEQKPYDSISAALATLKFKIGDMIWLPPVPQSYQIQRITFHATCHSAELISLGRVEIYCSSDNYEHRVIIAPALEEWEFFPGAAREKEKSDG